MCLCSGQNKNKPWHTECSWIIQCWRETKYMHEKIQWLCWLTANTIREWGRMGETIYSPLWIKMKGWKVVENNRLNILLHVILNLVMVRRLNILTLVLSISYLHTICFFLTRIHNRTKNILLNKVYWSAPYGVHIYVKGYKWCISRGISTSHSQYACEDNLLYYNYFICLNYRPHMFLCLYVLPPNKLIFNILWLWNIYFLIWLHVSFCHVRTIVKEWSS